MKRKLALVLATTMMMTMVGCSSSNNNNNNNATPEATPQAEADATPEADANKSESGSIGETLRNEFTKRIKEDSKIKPLDLASEIMTNEIIEFKPMTQEVQEGNLNGFDTEIKGFEQGVMFAPMIGSIPFVGYIFTVPESADVNDFVQTLKNHANPRWNVCTEADETIVEASGNTVFFLMCPKEFEE